MDLRSVLSSLLYFQQAVRQGYRRNRWFATELVGQVGLLHKRDHVMCRQASIFVASVHQTKRGSECMWRIVSGRVLWGRAISATHAAIAPSLPRASTLGNRFFRVRAFSLGGTHESQTKKKTQTDTQARGEGREREQPGDRDGEVAGIPLSELSFRFCRSSKPGGQSANKSETKAVLTVSMQSLKKYTSSDVVQKIQEEFGQWINKKGELVLSSERHSSQAGNKKECLSRLAEMLQQLRDRPEITGGKSPREFQSEESQLKYKARLIAGKRKNQYNRQCHTVNRRDW
uniref:Putative class I peptide chain release factor n=1 Tax=Toxoplasma gondii COUG TaxID=1074873 RepID=A0A2G8XNI1_TOXGO|nr:putative class I peptide chain release factor [Toxoplasma gondii COUG]